MEKIFSSSMKTLITRDYAYGTGIWYNCNSPAFRCTQSRPRHCSPNCLNLMLKISRKAEILLRLHNNSVKEATESKNEEHRPLLKFDFNWGDFSSTFSSDASFCMFRRPISYVMVFMISKNKGKEGSDEKVKEKRPPLKFNFRCSLFYSILL